MSSNSEVEALRQVMEQAGLLPDIPAEMLPSAEDSEAFLQEILRGKRPATPKRVARRPLLIAAAAVVVIALVAVLATSLRAPTAMAGTPPSLSYSGAQPQDLGSAPPAQHVLERAAAQAAKYGSPAAPGPVQYTATYGWNLAIVDEGQHLDVSIYPTTTEFWLAPDGSGRTDQYRAQALDVDGKPIVDPSPILGGAESSDPFPPGTFDAHLTETLSRSPAQLEQELLQTMNGLPCDQDEHWKARCLVLAVQQIYTLHDVPGDLASALWTVLSHEPALKDMGTAVDRLGRTAWAIGLMSPADEAASRVTVTLIAQDTGKLSGFETITLREESLGVTGPTVTGFDAWYRSTRVADVGSRN